MAVPIFTSFFPDAPRTTFQEDQINIVAFLTLQSMIFLVCGFYISYLMKRESKGFFISKIKECNKPENLIKAKKYFCTILLIGLISTLIGLLPNIRILFTYGYGYKQFYQNTVSYFANSLSSLLIFPGVIGAYYCKLKCKNKRFNSLVNSIILIYLILVVLSGLRMRALLVILAIFLMRNYYISKVSLRKILYGMLIVIIFVSLQLIYREKLSINLIADPVFVLRAFSVAIGSSGIILSNLTNWFPSYNDFYFGLTYINSIPALLPGFLFGGSQYRPFISGSMIYKYLFEVGQVDKSYIDLLNPNQGYGFSMIGEAYINFGILGPMIIFTIWGLILGNLYKKLDKLNHRLILFYFLIDLIMLISIRSDALVTVKFIVYGLVIFYLAPLPNKIRIKNENSISRIKTSI